MEKNHITPRDFMVGQSEADAFEQKRFLDMHRSTLSKVDVFATRKVSPRCVIMTQARRGVAFAVRGRSYTC